MMRAGSFPGWIVLSAALLVSMLGGPSVVRAAGPTPADARTAAAWDLRSGYGALEASRTRLGDLVATPWDATSGYGVLEANRGALGEIVQP